MSDIEIAIAAEIVDGGAGVLQKLSDVENLFLGIATGIIEVCIDQPQLYFKVCSQQEINPFQPFVLKNCYRGLLASCMNMGGLTGLQFWLAGAIQKIVTDGEDRALTPIEEIGSALLGGMISGVPCANMELVMTQQMRYGTSIFATPTKIIADTGILGMFRGSITAIGREGVFTLGYLGVGPAVETYCRRSQEMSRPSAALAGAVGGGVLASLLSHPMDTVKTCMQGDIKGERYTTLTKTARQLYSEGGIGAFYRGVGWRTSRLICLVGIINALKEPVAKVIYPRHFKTQDFRQVNKPNSDRDFRA